MDMKEIEAQAKQAVCELLDEAHLRPGDIFVVGCSSSEIIGGHIGRDSSLEAAQAVYRGLAPELHARGVYLAAQCCEHLNRAIILEADAAEKYGYEPVCVVPRPHAGSASVNSALESHARPAFAPSAAGAGSRRNRLATMMISPSASMVPLPLVASAAAT